MHAAVLSDHIQVRTMCWFFQLARSSHLPWQACIYASAKKGNAVFDLLLEIQPIFDFCTLIST